MDISGLVSAGYSKVLDRPPQMLLKVFNGSRGPGEIKRRCSLISLVYVHLDGALVKLI